MANGCMQRKCRSKPQCDVASRLLRVALSKRNDERGAEVGTAGRGWLRALVRPLGKIAQKFFETLERPEGPGIPLLGIYPKKMKIIT